MKKQKDLFDDYDNLPKELKTIFDKYTDDCLYNPYETVKKILNECETIGFTFDYGLDAIPFGLRPIGVNLNELEDF